jgi:hypothetical protein
MLFEAKTDNSTSSIYEAIGQLMFHGFIQSDHPKMAVILPSCPNKKTLASFRKLGIEVMSYTMRDKRPIISGIGQCLNGLSK